MVASFALWRLDGGPWPPPGPDLAVLVAAGVLAATAVSLLTMPVLDAATRPHAIRYE